MLGTTKCPFCAEIIQKKAIVCKHCHRELSQGELTQNKPEPKKQELSFFRRVLKRWYIHLFLWPISLPIELLAFIYHPDRVEKRKKADKEKQDHLESLPPKEKEAYLEKKISNKRETIRLSLMLLFWLMLGSVAFVFYLEPGRAYQVWIGFAAIFLAIWFQPAKGEGFFKNRFKQFKEHKVRMSLSVVALVIALFPFSTQLKEDMIEKQELAEQEFIENYPLPTIELLSNEDDQGDAMEYELKVKVEEATYVSANDEEMVQDPKDEKIYTLTIPLDSSEESINIEAENKYKETYEEIIITRTETEQEKEERLAREAKHAEEMAKLEESIKEAELKRKEAEQAALDFKRQQEAFGTGKYKLEAHVCAKFKVEDMLKSPKSADFPWVDYNEVVNYEGYNKYSVESYVDAQNSFGAMLRTNYRCNLEIISPSSCSGTCELY